MPSDIFDWMRVESREAVAVDECKFMSFKKKRIKICNSLQLTLNWDWRVTAEKKCIISVLLAIHEFIYSRGEREKWNKFEFMQRRDWFCNWKTDINKFIAMAKHPECISNRFVQNKSPHLGTSPHTLHFCASLTSFNDNLITQFAILKIYSNSLQHKF